jgi:hypothetical protein
MGVLVFVGTMVAVGMVVAVLVAEAVGVEEGSGVFVGSMLAAPVQPTKDSKNTVSSISLIFIRQLCHSKLKLNSGTGQPFRSKMEKIVQDLLLNRNEASIKKLPAG